MIDGFPRMKIFALAILTALVTMSAAPSQAALAGEVCKIDAEDNSSLTPCYQRELDEKTKANDKFYRSIVKDAKALGRTAAAKVAATIPKNKKPKSKKAKEKAKELAKENAKEKAKVTAFSNFIDRINNTIIENRKAALRSCVHMTSKFQDKELSDSAIANCRTEAELQLEKQLQNFESELKTLSK